MLGGSLLVAPVFDQQKHHIYLPEGSWVDLETGNRLSGCRWITYPKNIEVIPMFLRENTMIPMLAEAPEHITDEVFKDLTLVMNITDNLCQNYYDDGISGKCSASLCDGILSITQDVK
jgi:alpha-D-xyloside xylohydrolase